MCYVKRIIVSSLIVILILSQVIISTNAQSDLTKVSPSTKLNIATPCAILIDAKTGNILYEKNSDIKMYPASITKIMTAILGLEKAGLDETITMSRNAVMDLEPGSSNAGLMEGEELTVEQLLYTLLLWSANEAGNGIAEHISGNIENFGQLMTARAKEIGAKNTNFVNPHGLHNDKHYTTAYDMAMIAKHAMSIPKFREIVSTTDYNLPPTNKNDKVKDLFNGNKLIRTDSKYYYENAIGIKTGYTTKAGPTLVAAAKKGDVELIAVVLNSPIDGFDYYTFIDSTRMFEYGFENFSTLSIIDKSENLDEVKVNGSKQTIIPAFEKDIELLLPKNIKKSDIIFEKHINELSVPIKKNDKIGYVSLLYKGQELERVDVLSDKEIIKKSFSVVLKQKVSAFFKFIFLILKYAFFILLTLLIIFVLLTIIHNKKRRRKKRRKLN